MRTHQSALGTLYADLWITDGNLESQIAFLPFRCTDGPGTVHRKSAHRKQVPLPGHHHSRDFLQEIRCPFRNQRWTSSVRRRCFWYGYLVEVSDRLVYEVAIPSYDIWTAF